MDSVLRRRVERELEAMHNAMAGDRTRMEAWAAQLGVECSAEFQALVLDQLERAESRSAGEWGVGRVVAGWSQAIAVASAVLRLAPADEPAPPCICPVGFGQVRNANCPRHGRRDPAHTITGPTGA